MNGRALQIDEILAHSGWLRQLAVRLVHDGATADDLVQEAWITALQQDGSRDVVNRPWLATVLRNLVRMRYRGSTRRQAREQAFHDQGSAMPSPEALVQRIEAQQVLADKVRELDEPYRSTLLLHYYEGLPAIEIARRLGVPAGTIRWRHKHGLELLRKAMDECDPQQRIRRTLIMPIAPLAAAGAAGALHAYGSGSSWLAQLLAGKLAMGTAMVAFLLAMLSGWLGSPDAPERADGALPAALHGRAGQTSALVVHAPGHQPAQRAYERDTVLRIQLVPVPERAAAHEAAAWLLAWPGAPLARMDELTAPGQTSGHIDLFAGLAANGSARPGSLAPSGRHVGDRRDRGRGLPGGAQQQPRAGEPAQPGEPARPDREDAPASGPVGSDPELLASYGYLDAASIVIGVEGPQGVLEVRFPGNFVHGGLVFEYVEIPVTSDPYDNQLMQRTPAVLYGTEERAAEQYILVSGELALQVDPVLQGGRFELAARNMVFVRTNGNSIDSYALLKYDELQLSGVPDLGLPPLLTRDIELTAPIAWTEARLHVQADTGALVVTAVTSVGAPTQGSDTPSELVIMLELPAELLAQPGTRALSPEDGTSLQRMARLEGHASPGKKPPWVYLLRSGTMTIDTAGITPCQPMRVVLEDLVFWHELWASPFPDQEPGEQLGVELRIDRLAIEAPVHATGCATN